MNDRLSAAAIALATLLGPAVAAAQGPPPPAAREQQLLAAYAPVARSVVCIRTVVDRELKMLDPESALMAKVKSPLTIHGTGVVVGTVWEKGHEEYVILTNHHIADPSLYFDMDSRFPREVKDNSRAVPTIPEQSYVVDGPEDADASDDIRLVVIARDPAGDAALLETVSTPRPLPVFPGRIGFSAGQLHPGDAVITSGFPQGSTEITATGHLEELGYQHHLGIPHVDDTVDLPLDPGQSGSPVFLVTHEPGGDVQFTLIGLLHARDGARHLMVPYPLWQSMLAMSGTTTPVGLGR